MLTKRDTQPSLIWALAMDWAHREAEAKGVDHVQWSAVHVSIYNTVEAGGWIIRNGKLYQDSNFADDHFGNTAQDDLWVKSEQVGEVELTRFSRPHDTTLLGTTLEKALEKLRK